MILLLWISFLVFMSILFFVFYRYRGSRNRKLLLKDGMYKSFIWGSVFIFVGSVIIALLLPDKPFKSEWLTFHSEVVVAHLNDTNFVSRYFFKALSIFTEANLLGLIMASLTGAIWLYYVRALDFFDTENALSTVTIVLMGMFCAVFTFPLSDLIHGIFDIEYTHFFFYDLFVYCFLGIGVVEEFIKLIPVIFILYATSEVDEPMDLIYYACVSALGFAFLENLIYFRNISGNIYIIRTLLSVLGHMVFGVFTVYGLVLYKYNPERRNVGVIIKYFILGSFTHALFDYFLLENLLFLFIIFFIFVLQAWAILINNAINNSEYFSYKILYQYDKVRFNLMLMTVAILLLTFVFNGLFVVGRFSAIYDHMITVAWVAPLLAFQLSKVSSFDMVKGYWRRVRIRFSGLGEGIVIGGLTSGIYSKWGPFPPSVNEGHGGEESIFTRWFADNTIIPHNLVGERIKLHAPRYNHDLVDIFNIGSGVIKDRIKLCVKEGMDVDWFYVILDEPIEFGNDYHSHGILIKFESKYRSLVHDEHIRCYLRLIPKGSRFGKTNNKEDYPFYGYIIINGGDYEYKT